MAGEIKLQKTQQKGPLDLLNLGEQLHKMSDITTKIETITPQLAEKYLKYNETNRPIRWSHVESLKQDILAGRWFTTHQGIAFGQDGNLVDGQHRLLAIQASGKPVKILVTRGITNHINGDVNLFAMDVIDNGKMRSAADQLNLVHGVANSNLTVAALRTIATICYPSSKTSMMTTSRAVPLLALYGKELDQVISGAVKSKLARKAPIVGALAFAAKVDAPLALEFIESICTGESIKLGDPVYALRQHLIERSQKAAREDRQQLVEMVCNCFVHTMKATAVKIAKPGSYGIDILRTRQRGNVEKVRAILGINL